MPNIIKSSYEPYDKQLEVHQSCADESYKYTIVCASRQTGKTMLAMNQCIKWGVEKPDSVIAWVSPTYSQYKKVYDSMVKAIGSAPFVKSYKDGEIKFTSGAVMVFKSANAGDNLRGMTVNYMVVDEAILIKESTFLEVLMPTLIVGGKKCLIISTPKGKSNWFFRWFMYGSNREEGCRSFRFNYKTNPFKDDAFIRMAEKSMPDAMFRQEYLADFVDGGAVIENINELCVNAMQPIPKAGKTYYAGIDLALMDDYTVFSVVDADGNLVYFDRFNKISTPEVKERIFKNIQLWKPEMTLIETNNMGLPIYQDLKLIYKIKKLKGWNTSHTSKNDIITKLIMAFSSKEIQCPDNEFLKAELETFEMKMTPTGKVKYEHAQGFHDDIIMSMAIAREAQSKASSNRFGLKLVR